MYGEWSRLSCNCTILTKTHDFFHKDMSKFNGRAVVLLRNPYDAIISERHRVEGGEKHTGYAKPAKFSGPGKPRYLIQRI